MYADCLFGGCPERLRSLCATLWVFFWGVLCFWVAARCTGDVAPSRFRWAAGRSGACAGLACLGMACSFVPGWVMP